MPNPRNAAAYPVEYWTIAERYEKAPGEYPLMRLSFAEAVRWRHKFYTFRVALKAEGGAYRFKELFNAQLVLRDDDGKPVNMKNYKVGKWKTPNALMEGAKHEWGNGPWTTIWIRPAMDAGSNSEMLQAALAQMEANAKANPRPVTPVDLPVEHIRSTREPTPEEMGLTPEEAAEVRAGRRNPPGEHSIKSQLAGVFMASKAQDNYDDVFKKMFDKPVPSPDPERPTLEITETGTAVLSHEELVKREMLEDEKAGDDNGALSPPDSK